jgi:hypothetical protein
LLKLADPAKLVLPKVRTAVLWLPTMLEPLKVFCPPVSRVVPAPVSDRTAPAPLSSRPESVASKSSPIEYDPARFTTARTSVLPP